MQTRFDIERAVLESALPAGCRHVAHVLCIRIDAKSNMILSIYQPSISDLTRDTGLSRRSITRHLNRLEADGWIIRKRPTRHDALTKHKRTHYVIHIPPEARDTETPARDIVPEARDTEPKARVTVTRRSSGSSRSSGLVLSAIIEAIALRDSVTVGEEWAERVREQIIGARGIGKPEAYVRRVIMAAPPGTYCPQSTPPRFTKDGGFT